MATSVQRMGVSVCSCCCRTIKLTQRERTLDNQTSLKAELTSRLTSRAHELGFELVGVTPAISPSGYHRFLEWLELGYAGEMHYLPERAEAYSHPDSVLPGVASIMMLGMNYHTSPRQSPESAQGSVASYANGDVDYHDLIHGRLKQLKALTLELEPEANVRGVVDTAPLLEREFAQLAGLGWVGKNTLLLNKEYGSYFFLAALLTDLELVYDDPFEADHCGTCTACLDACPTDAFPQPNVLDARRCISYLTIEHRGDTPVDMLGTWDDWLFGCDICQEVCPWNNRVPQSEEPLYQARDRQNPVELAELFDLTDDQFRDRFRKTPLWRSKRRGILRNAALLLGSQKATSAKSALMKGSADDEPLVRNACEWALSQLDVPV